MTKANTMAATDSAPVTRFWQKISLIAEISHTCRRQRPEDPSFYDILILIQRIVVFDAATLWLRDRATGRFTPGAQIGEEVAIPGFLHRRDKNLPTGQELSFAEPIVWDTKSQPAEFKPPAGFVAVMSAPLLVEAELIGVLNFGSYAPGVLSDKSVKLVSIIADQVAVAIERLYRLADAHAENRTLKADQERLMAAERLKMAGRLAASINHEINNPLSVVVGQVQCLMAQYEDLDENIMARLKRIEDAALRISEVNRRLVNLDTTSGSNDRISNTGSFASGQDEEELEKDE